MSTTGDAKEATEAITEFEKYRIIKAQIYISDFDKYINELEELDLSDKN